MAAITPSPSFRLAIRLRYPNRPGLLAEITGAIATCGGNITTVALVERTREEIWREIAVDAADTDHGQQIVAALNAIAGVDVLDASDRTFALHEGGKIALQSRLALTGPDDLAMAYTPGVGRVCRAIAADPAAVYTYTIKANTVAVVTDGSAVLGLGNLGPEAALPVMEGKALLFKEFANIDAFPICLATQDTDEIVETVKRLTPVFGGINLEDISAPRCFEIERRLRAETDIPVFHDDQHGTAIVVLAALENALKLVAKSLAELQVAINGAGAAGIAIAHLLQAAGASGEQICLCDSKGIVSRDRADLNPQKQALAVARSGTLADALVGADVFVGVSVPGVLTPAMVKTMAPEPIVMAMANPIPEIQPELVRHDVAVMATGRSDYPNQINNVLAFPGVLRGALDARASAFVPEMYLAAARAIATAVTPERLHREYIIPSAFERQVAPAVAAAVANAARASGVARQ